MMAYQTRFLGAVAMASMMGASPAMASEGDASADKEVAETAAGGGAEKGADISAAAQSSASQLVLHRPDESPVAPDDPYPVVAGGWGLRTNNLFFSRYVEDWSRLKAAGKAPPFKAMPIGSIATLTLSTEERLRLHAYQNGLLHQGNDYHQLVFRALLGADLRVGDIFRVYAELGHGDAEVKGNPSVNTQSAQYNNELAVQQAFAEVKGMIGSAQISAMGGRFEFSDGPRQIISFSNGPNMHRTWNGYRLSLHTPNFRLSYFTAKPTALGYGEFDESDSTVEKLTAVTASIKLSSYSKNKSTFLDPLYYRNYNGAGSNGSDTGAEHRSTYGLRFWGSRGPVNFDYMFFRQTGDHLGQQIDAWLASANQSIQLTKGGWRPRVGVKVDVASGGGSYSKVGTIHSFVATYSSIGLFGEGHLLGQTNLALIAPNIEFEPLEKVRVSAEYDLAERMDQHDAVYYATRKPYGGTQNVLGHYVGTYGKIVIDYKLTRNLSFQIEGDHLGAGTVLNRAHLPGGNYGMLQMLFRY